MDELELQVRDGAVRFRVRVKPRSARSRVVGVRDGVLEVAVAAPPVEGRANVELARTLARHFGLRRTAVNILTGTTGRTKLVGLDGIGAEHVRSVLRG